MFNSISLPAGSDRPLFLQIYDQIRLQICDGMIHAGSRLPASRALADDLGVSRATVVTAYDQLIAEGYAEGRTGSGVFACDPGPLNQIKQAKPKQAMQKHTPVAAMPLRPNLPDASLFPARAWAQTVARAARNAPGTLFQLNDPFGDSALRHEISRHLLEWRGVNTQPEQILITGGSGEALDIALRLTCQPGDPVGLENPGYGPTRRFAREIGLIPHWLNIGPDGAILPAQNAPNLRAIVLTPSHQFPLGGTLPSGKRAEFLALARTSGGWIIEDDFDSEFRYAGRPIPAMAAMDTADRTIYVGGFSKVFSAGIRIGYMVLPTQLLPDARALIAKFPTRASVMPQRPLALFMADGTYHKHIRRVRRVYARRYNLLLDALEQHFNDMGAFQRANAGMHLALHLPAHLPDSEIAHAAGLARLGCTSLSTYCAGKLDVNGMLLGFCATPDDEINGSVRQLKATVLGHLRRVIL